MDGGKAVGFIGSGPMRRRRVRHVAGVHGKASATSSTSPGSPPSALRSSRPAAGRASSRTARTRARPIERRRDFFHVALAHRLPALRGHRVRHPAASVLRGHRVRGFTAGRSPRPADFAAGLRFMLPGHHGERVTGSASPGGVFGSRLRRPMSRRVRPPRLRPHGFGNAERGRPRGGGNVSCRVSWFRRGHTRAHKGRPGHRSSWGECTGEKATRTARAAYLPTGQHGGDSVARVPKARACAGRGEQAGTSIGRALHGRKGAGAVGRGRQRCATWGKPA